MLRKWMPLWAVPTLIIFAIGTVWLRLSIIRTTYSIHEANRNIAKIRQEKEQLQMKMAELRSPQRLGNLARTKFGLTQPHVGQIIHFGNTELTADAK